MSVVVLGGVIGHDTRVCAVLRTVLVPVQVVSTGDLFNPTTQWCLWNSPVLGDDMMFEQSGL